MHYRKSSPNPPRLLLRIAAAAGAGAVASACSSGSGHGVEFLMGSVGCQLDEAGACAGSVPNVPPDAAASYDSGDSCCPGLVDAGSSNILDAVADSDAALPCGTDVCGSVVMPSSDAGEASTVGGGVMVGPEGGPDQ